MFLSALKGSLDLSLNGKKCVLIPLWVLDETKVRNKLASTMPTWSGFSVRSFGKYLGFLLGPGAANQEWDTVFHKVSASAEFIKSLGLPKLAALTLYKMFGVSQIQHIAQIRSLPASAKKVENEVLFFCY